MTEPIPDKNPVVLTKERRKVLVLNGREYRNRISDFDELKGSEVPLVEVADEDPVSERENPHGYWISLTKMIETNYNLYDGFVIMQGIDTMVNTACMLAFLLENLGKSVVLTGAVTSLQAAHTDWRRNFVLSCMYSSGKLPGSRDCCEVVIIFADRVFRGVRAILESSSNMQPFSSPFFPPLAEMRGHRLDVEPGRYLRAPTGPLIAHTDANLSEILLLTVTPSMSREAVFRLVEHSPSKALVIQAFGSGNVPFRAKAVIEAAQRASDRGMIVIVVSQVRRGTVELGVYYTGGPLSKVAISAGDMTLEATAAKVKYLLGMGWSPQDVRILMTRSLRGELTEVDPISGSKL